MRNLMNSDRKKQTQRIEKLSLTPTSKVLLINRNDKFKLFLFKVHLKDFAKAFQKHGNLLFAGNIGYGLKGKANQAGKIIDHILSEHDKEFIFSHSGITMVAQKLKKIGKNITLTKPSVVDGALTISCIGQKWLKNIDVNKAEVMVSVIEVQPQALVEELETDIAMHSSTQTKVDFRDLITQHFLKKVIYQ